MYVPVTVLLTENMMTVILLGIELNIYLTVTDSPKHMNLLGEK